MKKTVTARLKALDKQIGGRHYNTMKIQPIEYTMAKR